MYFDFSCWIPLPPTRKIIFQICVFLLVEDTNQYWAHRALHWSPLYQRIHKKYHTYSATFWFVGEYASPFEIILIGFGTVGFPFLYSKFTDSVHLFTFGVWIFIRVLGIVDSHSGYNLPWSAHQFLPFLAGPAYHDLHHKKSGGNYAMTFRW
jgi:methylsterol monooxygenase